MARKNLSDGDEIVSGQALGARLGLTATRVSKLGGDGVMLRAGRGKYRAWASAKSCCESHSCSPEIPADNRRRQSL